MGLHIPVAAACSNGSSPAATTTACDSNSNKMANLDPTPLNSATTTLKPGRLRRCPTVLYARIWCGHLQRCPTVVNVECLDRKLLRELRMKPSTLSPEPETLQPSGMAIGLDPKVLHILWRCVGRFLHTGKDEFEEDEGGGGGGGVHRVSD